MLSEKRQRAEYLSASGIAVCCGARTHACRVRTHANARFLPAHKSSHECEDGTQECVRHIGCIPTQRSAMVTPLWLTAVPTDSTTGSMPGARNPAGTCVLICINPG
jgi:hypothetical protein